MGYHEKVWERPSWAGFTAQDKLDQLDGSWSDRGMLHIDQNWIENTDMKLGRERV